MPPKSKQELREWYDKFSQELYDKVELDVTRKEDLGRVRVFKSDQWSVDNLAPDMQVTYAYMSHDGTQYADPEPPLGKFQDYAMVFSNLFTEQRSNVNHELRFVDPARQKAREAIEAYGRNEPEKLGKLLGHGLRHNMMEAASHVLNCVVSSHQEQTLKLDGPERAKIAERIGKIPAHQAVQDKLDKFRARAAAADEQARLTNSDADIDKANDLREQTAALQTIADLIKEEKDITNGKITLLELKRESAPILKDLIKPDWVNAAKDQLAKQVNLTEVITSNKSIVDMFASACDLGMTTKDVLSNINAEQMEKLIEPDLVMQNNDPQISQPGAIMN